MQIDEPGLNGASMEAPEVVQIQRPQREHGSAVWDLVRRSNSLELNSCYAYLLLTSHFADTSLVAELHGRVVGFVMAYRPPTHADAVFVWQIGVDTAQRSRGLGTALLHALIRCPGCKGAKYVEATVGSSNEASTRLFEGFARSLGTRCEVMPGFSSDLFKPTEHETEDLFRIGPIHPDKISKLERLHETV